jgi:hypothetical protein
LAFYPELTEFGFIDVLGTCETKQFIETTAAWWGCCAPGAADCEPATSCSAGTLYYPAASIAIW